MLSRTVHLGHGRIRSRPESIRHLTTEDDLYLRLFDDLYERLQATEDQALINQALEELCLALQERMINSTPAEWKEFIALGRRHRLITLLHQDPFTYRAYSKPRGYAGDAEMMDFIYGREEFWSPPPAEPIGQRVFNFTTLSPACEGVRARRAFVAARIDRLAEERHRPHILSIASGHLREAGLSAAVRRRRTGRFVALDADAQSAGKVQQCYGNFGVEAVTASFRKLLTKKGGAGEFDLVYSTGLFDYLNQRTARRLTSGMFQMLRPGGSLVIANFLPNIRDIGYMEAFMDWNLIYRTRYEMTEMTLDIPESEVQDMHIQSEEQKNIIFLTVTKAC